MILPNYSSMRCGSELIFCAPIRSIISSLVILGSVLKSFSTPKAWLIHFRGMTSPLPSYVFQRLPACGSEMYVINWTCLRLFNSELSSFDVPSWNTLSGMWPTLIYASFGNILFEQKKKAVVVRIDAYIQVPYVTYDMTENVYSVVW
jgi:hypothetical protein